MKITTGILKKSSLNLSQVTNEVNNKGSQILIRVVDEVMSNISPIIKRKMLLDLEFFLIPNRIG